MTDEQMEFSLNLAIKKGKLCEECRDKPRCERCEDKVLQFLEGYKSCFYDDPEIKELRLKNVTLNNELKRVKDGLS